MLCKPSLEDTPLSLYFIPVGLSCYSGNMALPVHVLDWFENCKLAIACVRILFVHICPCGTCTIMPCLYYLLTYFVCTPTLLFESISIASYVAGAAMGTFIMLYVYIFFFDKIKDKNFTTQKNMNYIIGTITGVIAIITLVNIIKEL